MHCVGSHSSLSLTLLGIAVAYQIQRISKLATIAALLIPEDGDPIIKLVKK